MNLNCASFKPKQYRSAHARKATRSRLITAILVSLGIATPLHADIAADSSRLLEMWSPDRVAYEFGTLTVVLPQDRITEQIYLSVIKFGLCLGPLQGVDLQAVENIEIVNRHARQGYVYESGVADCERFNDRATNDRTTDIEILGNTHWYP